MVLNKLLIIIIICDIYIAPYSARSCSKALYNMIYNNIIHDSDLIESILVPKYIKRAKVVHIYRSKEQNQF